MFPRLPRMTGKDHVVVLTYTIYADPTKKRDISTVDVLDVFTPHGTAPPMVRDRPYLNRDDIPRLIHDMGMERAILPSPLNLNHGCLAGLWYRLRSVFFNLPKAQQ